MGPTARPASFLAMDFRSKNKYLRQLSDASVAEVDLALLCAKAPTHPQLRRFSFSPARYATEILYALLDVATPEQILAARHQEPAVDAPSTEAPGQQEPTADSPSAEAPGQQEPTADSPSAEALGHQEPTADSPSAEALGQQDPAADSPSTDTANSQWPVTAEPAATLKPEAATEQGSSSLMSDLVLQELRADYAPAQQSSEEDSASAATGTEKKKVFKRKPRRR